MLLANCVLNNFIKLKYLTAFYLGGIHFSMCLKFFSFGHVLYEVNKVIRAMKKGTFDKEYTHDDINEIVS